MEGNVLNSNVLVELGTAVIEVILIVLYCYRLKLRPRKPALKIIICFVCFFIPLMLMSMWHNIPLLRIIYSCVGLVMLFRYCYSIDLPNSIYTTAIFLILSVSSDILCSYLVNIAGIPNNGVLGDALDRITYNGISKLIHLILIQIVPSLIKRKKEQLSFIGALPLLTAQFSSLLICLCLYFSGTRSGEVALETIFGVIATLYVNIVICFYVEVISIKNDLLREKELTEREYQHSLRYYESIKQSQEETRSLWHEIQKYLNTIRTLVDGGNNQAAVECMAEVEQIYGGLTNNVDVGNNIINEILSVGLQRARQNNIPFEIDVWIAPYLEVAPQDLFIILGNAIDNAIEECIELPPTQHPFVNVSIHQKDRILVIKVENPCRSSSPPKPGKIHGYGLKNIKRCVDKYNGELQAVAKENMFLFFALLNMNQSI